MPWVAINAQEGSLPPQKGSAWVDGRSIPGRDHEKMAL